VRNPERDEEFERHIQLTREAVIADWGPPAHPHCSNCLHAVVGGPPEEPRARCELGYGRPMPLWTLIRASKPRQFTPARDCADFASMSDDGEAS
jgi:hypothetical protein